MEQNSYSSQQSGPREPYSVTVQNQEDWYHQQPFQTQFQPQQQHIQQQQHLNNTPVVMLPLIHGQMQQQQQSPPLPQNQYWSAQVIHTQAQQHPVQFTHYQQHQVPYEYYPQQQQQQQQQPQQLVYTNLHLQKSPVFPELNQYDQLQYQMQGQTPQIIPPLPPTQQLQQQQDHMASNSRQSFPSSSQEGYRLYNTIFGDNRAGCDNKSTKPNLEILSTALRNPIPPYAIATINSGNSNSSINQESILSTDTYSAPHSVASNSSAKASKSKDALLPKSTRSKTGYRNSRRKHRNSHLGCATCKSRRIKCDEELPQCHNCVRARLRCAYLALDDTARAALKSAQEAQATRLQSLNSQGENSDNENNGQLITSRTNGSTLNLESGLPSKIFISSPTNTGLKTIPIKINLQKPLLNPIENQLSTIYNHTTGSTLLANSSTSTGMHYQAMHPQNTVTIPLKQTSHSSTSVNTMTERRNSTLETPRNATATAPFSIKSDNYAALSKLLIEHKDLSPTEVVHQSSSPDEYLEIVLDPKCSSKLNKNWATLDPMKVEKFKDTFEYEDLYQEYDKYYRNVCREAVNNIVLFKALISNGAILLHQFSKNKEVREVAEKRLNREYEITLRFLNNFKINFPEKVDDPKAFYEQINISFSKFEIYQSALPTSYYGPHSINDNIELTNRFFNFLLKYLNTVFPLFTDEVTLHKYKGNEDFEKAKNLNGHIHLFIDYFVQCIKGYHTAEYNTDFMNEVLIKFQSLRTIIYQKLPENDRSKYDSIEEFLINLTNYFTAIKNSNTPGEVLTNRIQTTFYILKKWLSICPEEAFTNRDVRFEQRLFYSYCHACIAALSAIYPEIRFFYMYGFYGRDGTIITKPVLTFFDNNKNEDQKALLNYPIKIIKFFKTRALLISEYLKDVSNLPAKILLDESNKHILRNLVKEKQMKSFDSTIPQEAYPNIDKSSNFYNKTTNSIIIPSVLNTNSFSNFDKAQLKRAQLLQQAVNDGLTKIDKEFIDKLLST